MKKLFSLMLLLATMMVSFSACSEDEANELEQEQAQNEIIGSWSEVTVSEGGDYVSMTLEIIWTFNQNNTASQRVIARLNDYVFEDITNTYSYIYDGLSSITFTDANNRVWTYTIEVDGNKMRLGNEEDGYFNLTKQ